MQPPQPMTVRNIYGTDTVVLGRFDRCIYCASQVELSDEHIVPYSLNGAWVLEKASCPTCRDKTSRFERHISREAFLPARAKLGLQTYRPKERPRQFPLMITKPDGSTFSVVADSTDHPSSMVFPVFRLPAKLGGVLADADIHMEAQVQITSASNELLDSVLSKHEGTSVTEIVSYRPVALAQLVAKIAYCFAVVELGLEAWEEVYVLRAILGDSTRIGEFVGSPAEYASVGDDRLHVVTVGHSEQDETLAWVRLFASFGAPTYVVVVGRRRPTT